MSGALAALLTLLAPQADEAAVVRAAQVRRTAVVARVAPAVCSVMPLGSDGGGSGVVIDPAGFVLTNFHVVQRPAGPPGKAPKEDQPPGGEPEEENGPLPRPRFGPLPRDDDANDPAWKVMKVGLPDGELYLADVLGIDPGSDLAVLCLRPHPEGKPYPYAPLGDSDRLLAGETVLACGNPFLLATDFTPTVTWGVVSGTHRYQPGGAHRFLVYADCIQVDAPVNPGNSGGPLFDEHGAIVGINGRISIRDRGRVNTGVGFAIASRQIRNFLADLLAGRHAEHGTLDCNAWLMRAPGGKRQGVFVQSTFADAEVARLGLELGDEITTFNGEPVRSANQLATLVGVLPAGSWVTLGYRPRAGDGFEAERTIGLRLRRLDTGSSRNEDRLASEHHRRLARLAFAPRVGQGEAELAGCTITLRAPDGTEQRWLCRGPALRLEAAGHVLVLDAGGQGFAQSGSAVADLDAEQRALLERTRAVQPLLWRGGARRALLDRGLLVGGCLVFGRPAYRFRQEGDGEREVWLHEDGTPAGCRYRDPVARAIVEWWLAGDGRAARVVDGVREDGWAAAVDDTVPDAALLSRPGG